MLSFDSGVGVTLSKPALNPDGNGFGDPFLGGQIVKAVNRRRPIPVSISLGYSHTSCIVAWTHESQQPKP